MYGLFYAWEYCIVDPTYTNEGHACQGRRRNVGGRAQARGRAARRGREPPMRIRGLGMTWRWAEGGREAEGRKIRNCKMFGD